MNHRCSGRVLLQRSHWYSLIYLTIYHLWVLCSLCSTSLFGSTHSAQGIETANEKYHEAQQAITSEERSKFLNEALSIYLSYAKGHPSSALLNNIGCIYFALGDYGLAICHYHRALHGSPRNQIIQRNLQTALSRAEVTHLQQERPLVDLIGFRWCTPLERAALAIGIISITFIFFSLNLWLPSFGFSWLWRLTCMLTLTLLGCYIWYALIVPQQAVAIKATPLRAFYENDVTAPTLTTVQPGEVVAVLGTDSTQHWIRVRTTSATIGYLPGQDLCFISE